MADIADDLLALHSSDPATVFLSAWVRMLHPSSAAVEQALYDDRTLIRHHAMRRTLWVATPEVMAQMNTAATRKVAANERRLNLKMLAAAGLDAERWLADATEHVMTVLHDNGPLNTHQLGALVPELGIKVETQPGNPKTAVVSAHTRVLALLGFEGRLVRTRPSGAWNASHYVWAAMDDWAGRPFPDLDLAEASRDLADRWLRAFGPAPALDLQWWMGWTKTQTARALADCDATEVQVDPDTAAYVASGDLDTDDVDPWIAVLPSLDATTMGWKQRDWYLPAHASDAFDRNGNAGPTIWVDGRVVGAWAQAKDGHLRTLFFEQLPPSRRREIDARLDEVRAWLGDTVVSERFPGRARQQILA